MTDIRPRSLQYKPAKEHILRAIGASLIVHWDEMPDALQDLVIDQAVLMENSAAEPIERGEVETFIRQVRVRDVVKPKPEAAAATV